MKKSIFLLLTLALILALVTTGIAKKPAPSLRCTINYVWAGDHWEGTISGDINGDIVWPPGSGPPTGHGQTAHYEGGFVISDTSGFVMSGEGSGSTTVRHGKNSNWRTSGTVTDAREDMEDWIDRSVHQEGTFEWDPPGVPGVPKEGSGTFRVN
ncbi:MAG: hypothetical protein ACYS3N_20585 [Planctomycetota bacterium]|jgi:hypothetical protein